MLTSSDRQIQFLMNVLNQARVGLWHLDPVRRRFCVNQSFARLLGIDELRAIDCDSWFETTETVMVWFEGMIAEEAARRATDSFSVTKHLRHRSGHPIEVRIDGQVPETGAAGQPLFITGTLTDITPLEESKHHLDYRLQIEKLVSDISSEFVGIRSELIDAAINNSIRKIGQFCKIDRSYLFLYRNNGNRMDNTHEWCAPGIRSEKDNLQDLPCAALPWWSDQLQQGHNIYIYDLNELPEEAAVEKSMLEVQDIRSLLVVPLMKNRELIGFLGFDSVNAKKRWDQSDIDLLTTVANTFTHAIIARRANDLILEQRDKSEEANRLKSAFLATINHELRTPLHHILGFSELIRGVNLSPQITELYASKIYDSGKNLLQIVEDILSLATGNLSEIKIYDEEITGIDLLVQHQTYLSEYLASVNRTGNIRLLFNSDPAFLNTRFRTDRNKVNQIVINLFKNAVKFTPGGTIEYGISVQNKQLRFYLKDEGIGIAPDNRSLIFEYFRQVEESSTRRFPGIGIGLAICKNLVQILNGQIELTSEVGKGSLFSVTIPVSPAGPKRSRREAGQQSAIPDFSGYRFLIVHEDPAETLLLKNLLAATKASIITTGSDLEALSFLGEGCLIDLILVDLKPTPDRALALIRELRNNGGRCEIIGLSPHRMIAEREKVQQAGCLRVVSKPVSPYLLYEAIREGLEVMKKGLRPGSPSSK